MTDNHAQKVLENICSVILKTLPFWLSNIRQLLATSMRIVCVSTHVKYLQNENFSVRNKIVGMYYATRLFIIRLIGISIVLVFVA